MAEVMTIGDSLYAAPAAPTPAATAPEAARHTPAIARHTAAADTAAADTVLADSVASDTTYVIVVNPAEPAETLPAKVSDGGVEMSWIIGGLMLLFVVAAIRFSRNSKYLAAMFRDATEIRERRNVFDDTVRETSFMVLLNLLWCVSGGILLYSLLTRTSIATEGISALWTSLAGGTDTAASGAPLLKNGNMSALLSGITLPGETIAPAWGMALCAAGFICYSIFMLGAYSVVGNVFSDRPRVHVWVRGYLASCGLGALLFFPLALITLCYPGNVVWALDLALFGFILTKIMFICMSFRIFFAQIASWVLFLYYLCSLEIAPLFFLYSVCGKIGGMQ